MNNKMKIKKTISTMLIFAMILGVFGVNISGPDSNAVTYETLPKISIKTCAFNVSGYDFDEVANQTLYEGYPVSLLFKRTAGSRIPKGTYLYILKRNDYEGICDEGFTLNKAAKFCISYTKKTALNYNELSYTWKNGWNAGKYMALLTMPYTKGKNTYYATYHFSVRVKRYG